MDFQAQAPCPHLTRTMLAATRERSTFIVQLSSWIRMIGVDIMSLRCTAQDTARNFLGGGNTDRRKFDLFMEATMLAQFKHKLSTATFHVNKMRVSWRFIDTTVHMLMCTRQLSCAF